MLMDNGGIITKIVQPSRDYTYSTKDYFSNFQKTEYLALGSARMSDTSASRLVPDKLDPVATGQ